MEQTRTIIGGPWKEPLAVYGVSLLLTVALVRLGGLLGLDGAVPALVGAVFILLPVLVLDRTGKPYERYGLVFKNPLPDLPLVLLLCAVTFPPIVAFIWLLPAAWGVEGVNFKLALPPGYGSIAASHLIVVAVPEEFFYRGYLQGRLDDAFGRKWTILGASLGPGTLLTSALFALGHFAVDFHPARLLVFFPAIAFGWLRERRGQIAGSVIYHALCNIFMDLFRAGYGL